MVDSEERIDRNKGNSDPKLTRFEHDMIKTIESQMTTDRNKTKMCFEHEMIESQMIESHVMTNRDKPRIDLSIMRFKHEMI